MAATRSLIWFLLDVAAPQVPLYPGAGSRDQTAWGAENEQHEYLTVEDGVLDSSPTNLRESTAHYASPPEWTATRRNQPHGSQIQDGDRGDTQVDNTVTLDRGDGVLPYDFSWGSGEHTMMLGDSVTPFNWWWEFNDL